MQNYGRSHKRFAFPLRGGLGVAVCLFSVQVFRCARLDARGILGLREDKLIGRLTKVFQEYRGGDSIRIVWGHQGLPDSFAGIPLKGNSISVVASRPREERNRHRWKSSRDRRTRHLNAAHILTAFWKLNGPRILVKLKERRNLAHMRILNALWRLEERRNAVYVLTTFWKLSGPRFLEKMKERRNTAHILNAFWKLEERTNAAHILTTFWKVNGQRFLERMKERRRYFSPRYKYAKNCCLMMGIRGDRNCMY